MTSRHSWFIGRIDECIEHLAQLKKLDDWQAYKDAAHEIACELMYATTSWDKYYRDLDDKDQCSWMSNT